MEAGKKRIVLLGYRPHVNSGGTEKYAAAVLGLCADLGYAAEEYATVKDDGTRVRERAGRTLEVPGFDYGFRHKGLGGRVLGLLRNRRAVNALLQKLGDDPSVRAIIYGCTFSGTGERAKGKAVFVQHFDLQRHYLSLPAKLAFGNALKRCSRAVCFTEQDAAVAKKRCPNVSVVPLFGFDYDEGNRRLMAACAGERGQGGELVYAGAVDAPRKNVALLNEAAKILKRQIHIYGPGKPPFAPCEYLVFHGPKTEAELIRIFTRAKLFLLPSKLEGYSFALVQAMSVGLPFVSTPSADSLLGLSFGGKHGLFTETFAPAEFAQRVDEALHADFDRGAILRRYADGYSYAEFAARWRAVLGCA